LNDVTSGEVQSIFLVRPNLNGCPEMCPWARYIESGTMK
jgi:hypothetical protein